MEIKKGDIVKLKSGGPKMTAEAFKWDPFAGKYNESEILCTWFKGEERFSEYFNVSALVKVPQKKH
jgi:uncharacterized protein YodC (DUF2158 family)